MSEPLPSSEQRVLFTLGGFLTSQGGSFGRDCLSYIWIRVLLSNQLLLPSLCRCCGHEWGWAAIRRVGAGEGEVLSLDLPSSPWKTLAWAVGPWGLRPQGLALDPDSHLQTVGAWGHGFP